VTKNVEFATFTQTVMIRTVLLNTGSSPKSSKAGSGIYILYLLTGPIVPVDLATSLECDSVLASSTGLKNNLSGRNTHIIHFIRPTHGTQLHTNKGSQTIQNNSIKPSHLSIAFATEPR